MTHYEGDFNLILGSDLASGAYHVKITDEGHFIDKEGQVIASLAPWPFEMPHPPESEAAPVEPVPDPAGVVKAMPEQDRLFLGDEEVPDEEGDTGG